MKLLRVCLAISILLVGLALPQAAGAAIVKVRTKFVFEEEDSGLTYQGAWLRGYYSEPEWSVDTTSVPNRTIRGRLMYYRTSDKKWVPYKYRPITFDVNGVPRAIKSNFAGNFRVTLDAPRIYSLSYAGNKYSRPCSANVAREDWTRTECLSSVTTSSIDATRTKVDVSLSYRYNPYVDRLADWELTGASGVVIRSALMVGGEDIGIGNVSWNTQEEESGIGGLQWSCVLPANMIEGQDLSVDASIDYRNGWIHPGSERVGKGLTKDSSRQPRPVK